MNKIETIKNRVYSSEQKVISVNAAKILCESIDELQTDKNRLAAYHNTLRTVEDFLDWMVENYATSGDSVHETIQKFEYFRNLIQDVLEQQEEKQEERYKEKI